MMNDRNALQRIDDLVKGITYEGESVYIMIGRIKEICRIQLNRK